MRSGAERVVSGALRPGLFSRVGGYSSQKGVILQIRKVGLFSVGPFELRWEAGVDP